jgi:Protein of unknown function (DUF3999)
LIALLALGLALQASPALTTGLPDQWKNWRYSMTIEAGNTAVRQMVRVTLPMQAVVHSQSIALPDLRIIDDTGREVPFVVDISRAARTGTWRYVPTSEFGFVPGSYTQIVADKVSERELSDGLRINSDEANYFTFVEIAASDDDQTWRIVREEAPIFKFERDNLRGTQTVAFPATRARWLRVRVLDPAKSFNIQSIEVVYNETKPAELEPWPLAFKHNSQSEAQQTWLEADATGPALPGSVVQLDAEQGEYHRPVRISTSDDGQTWTEVGEGVIARSPTQSTNRIEFEEVGGRYWRIAVFNHNDPPVAGFDAKLLASPRHVAFRQEPGRSYRLIYGDSRAVAPQYDVTDLTTPSERAAGPAVLAGAEEINAAYVSPEPWTEQHPVILWIALVFTVIVMAGLAIRTLRR